VIICTLMYVYSMIRVRTLFRNC